MSFKEEIIDLEKDSIIESGVKRRIAAIDVSRGVAMILIMALHFGLTWMDEGSVYLAAAAQILLEFMGPSMFIILSSISVIFTVKRKQERTSEKVIRLNIFARGFTVIILGSIMNLVTLNIWGWNILMFIGFGQIITYYAQKIKIRPRIVIGLVLLLVSEPIRETLWLYGNTNIITSILNLIISSPVPHYTLLPWLSVCFLVSVIGEKFYEVLNDGTEIAYRKLFRALMVSGTIFVIFGILIGFELKSTANTVYYDMYPYLELLDIWNHQNFAQVPGLPKFLITATTPYIFYHLGMDLLFIGGIFYALDIKKLDNIFINMLKFYGKASLNLFLIEYIFVTIFQQSLTLVYFVFVVVTFIGFLGIFMYLWENLASSIGTPEWLLGLVFNARKKKEEKLIMPRM